MALSNQLATKPGQWLFILQKMEKKRNTKYENMF
jgi:hypothetical protein